METSDDRHKIVEKAHKLKALADRGIDGEKETAILMLDRYRKKFNVTDMELDDMPQDKKYTEDDFENLMNELRGQYEHADLVVGGALVLMSLHSRSTVRPANRFDVLCKGIRLIIKSRQKK